MENDPFEDVFPIQRWGNSIAMLVYQGVTQVFRMFSVAVF